MSHIRGIFFDLGGTLRYVQEDQEAIRAAKERLAILSGTTLSPDHFHQMLNER